MKGIILLLVLAVTVWGCDAPPTQSTSGGSNDLSGSLSDQSQNTAAWPSPAPKGKEVQLAANVLMENYYIVFDGSGSMDEKACGSNQKKVVVGKQALREFAKTVPAGANLGLLVFSRDGIREVVPLGSGPKNREDFARAVENIRADGGTPLYSAIKIAYEKLEEQARRQLGYGVYRMGVVTDGEANSGEDPTSIVNFMLKNSPVTLTTIGFCIGEKHSLNQPGRVTYREARDLDSLRQGLKEVLAESPVFDATVFEKQ